MPKKSSDPLYCTFFLFIEDFVLINKKKVESFLGAPSHFGLSDYFAMKLFAFLNLLSTNFALLCEHEKLRETADDLKRIKHNTGKV